MKKSFKVLGTGLLALGLVVSNPGISDIVSGTVNSGVEASSSKVFNKAGKIYASGSTRAKVLLNVKSGQEVTVLSVRGSWAQVRVGKVTGWTANRDLSVKVVSQGVGVTKVFNKNSSLRASASSKAKAVLFVKSGNKAEVLRVSGSWSQVKVGTKIGWTASRDLSNGVVTAPSAVTGKIFNKDSVVRSSGSTKAKVLLSVKNGQAVSVLKVSGSWSQVRVGKVTGWTASRDLGTTLVTKAATSKVAFDLKTSRSAGSKTLTKVSKGAGIRLVAVHGSWSEVVANGKRGFVATRSILVGGKPVVQPTPPVTTPTPNPGTGGGTVTPTPNPVSVERGSASVVGSRVKNYKVNGVTYFDYSVNSQFGSVSYDSPLPKGDQMSVVIDDKNTVFLSYSLWNTYAGGANVADRVSTLNVVKSKSSILANMVYGSGTVESKNLVVTLNSLIDQANKEILADYKNLNRFYKDGELKVNGDTYRYVFMGSNIVLSYVG